MKNKQFLLCIAVFVALAVLAGCTENSPTEPGPTITQPATTQPSAAQPSESQGATEGHTSFAPDFTVYDRNGDPVKLSDFRGKPVILNFWASKCPPCRSEMPDFQKAYEEYGNEIHFVMVNLTDGTWDTTDSAKAFVDGLGYTFPVYFDTDNDAANTYHIYSIPTTYFIDANGSLVAYGVGALDMESLMSGIEMIQP